MAPLFRPHSNIQCFFCNSSVLTPQDPRNFRCPACGCLNRYNKNGEIVSDEPAMHEESLNRASFSKRASPSKDQLPNLHRRGIFCHDCQTNQMLIVHLLSNYLPPPESPEYRQRVKMMSKYKESLYTRYPPLCESCRPAVEDEIRNKDQMARRKALNGWLQGGKDRQRRTSGTPTSLKEKVVVKEIYWCIRGFLWFASSMVSISSLVLGLLGYSTISRLPHFLSYSLPILVLVSVLWTAWDPTYLIQQKAKLQNRDVRVPGKRKYSVCQMLAWFSRLTLSTVFVVDNQRPNSIPSFLRNPWVYTPFSLAIELLALLAYPLFLQVHHPPPIRLIDTHSHLHLSRSSTPASQSSTPMTPSFPKLTEQDLLASLSLSSKPVMTPPPIPVFGLPSLGGSVPSLVEPKVEDDDDAMDWSPLNDDSRRKPKVESSDSSSWLRPQRFFAPEKPTGLENLFARTRLDDDMQVDQQPADFSASNFLKGWMHWYLPIIVTVFSMFVAYAVFWLVRRKDASVFDLHVHGEL